MLPTTDNPLAPPLEVSPQTSSFFKAIENLSFDDAISKLANGIITFGFRLLIAVLVFYVGKFVITKLYKFTRTLLVNRHIEPSLTTFILSLIKMVLYFILIVTVIGILGIETSSFLALFASAGVAVGMALSGTLQNFAGGVLILLLKPYKVGDFIEAQGYTGTVKAIQIFHTVVNTVDNKAIIIPNGGLSTGSINNYSLERYRRVDWTISLSYGCDLEMAKEKIRSILATDSRIVKKYIEDDILLRDQKQLENQNQFDLESFCEENPTSEKCKEIQKKESWWSRFRRKRRLHKEEIQQSFLEKIKLNSVPQAKVDRSPFVGLQELADSSINIVVRAWTQSSDYWPLYFEMNERFYKELPAAGFDFPFPQLDVHCISQS